MAAAKCTAQKLLSCIDEAGFDIAHQIDHIGLSQTLLKLKKRT
jgi:hypothetical protein